MINSELFSILPKLKICGLTKYEDLQICLDTGVDFIGFNLYPKSKRYLKLNDAYQLWDRVCSTNNQHKTVPVFVVVQPTAELLKDISQTFGAECLVQFHGGENVQDISDHLESVPDLSFWQAVGVSQPDISLADRIHPRCQLVLFDALPPDKSHGGSGQTFDWQWLKSLTPEGHWGLAGGIRLQNLTSALNTGAHLIDVASGAERSPGIKDQSVIRQMVQCVHGSRLEK